MSMVCRIFYPARVLTGCALCLWLALLAGCSSDDQIKPLKPLRIATGTWEPFVGEDLVRNGPMAEMMSTILADLGYVPEFQFYDWRMVEKHLETGYPGLAFPMIKSEERTARGFKFSEPMHTFDYVLFYLKDRAGEFNSIKSLQDIMNSGFKIGRIRGYARLREIASKDNYIDVSSAAEGFALLGSNADAADGKQIDFLLESRSVGLATLASEAVASDRDDYLYLGQNGREQLISQVSLRVMVSPKVDPDLLPKINKAIEHNKEFFDSLRASVRSHGRDTAWLNAPDGEIIWGYPDSTGDAASIMIVRNSRVLINQWGSSYTGESGYETRPSGTGRSRVKLLSGPARGKVVWVEDRFITLEH
jgi:ABC-type amino acid transport substrate-binding protein